MVLKLGDRDSQPGSVDSVDLQDRSPGSAKMLKKQIYRLEGGSACGDSGTDCLFRSHGNKEACWLSKPLPLIKDNAVPRAHACKQASHQQPSLRSQPIKSESPEKPDSENQSL